MAEKILQSSARELCAETLLKIASMTLATKLNGNWGCFQRANNTPLLRVTGGVIAHSARMPKKTII